VVEALEKRKATKDDPFSTGLSDRGVFGPLLGVVMTDMVKSTISWEHWENGTAGDLAVFGYSVNKDKSNFTISYCCVPTEHKASHVFEGRFGYHGEITIEPMSGAVLRLVVETEPDPSLPITRADIAVDYSPVEIGGKSYVCPRKSIAISTVTSQLYQPKMSLTGGSFDTFPWNTVTAINDVSFDRYHLFRAEMRVLPGRDSER
jgi:hypothetical protein